MSHEQIDFKKRHVYGLDMNGKPQEDSTGQPVKTTQDEINDLKTEFNQQLLNTFQGKSAPDIHTLIIKQDQTDMFGLRITSRTCAQVNHLFEFDIDEYISFMQMRQMLKLPREAAETWTEVEWTKFLQERTLMEFKIVESEDEMQGWGELARNMLNSFSQSIIVNSDESLRRTVLLNMTRGNSLFPDESTELDITSDIPKVKMTYLFMINRSTELIGQFIKSDFVLLKHTTEIEMSNRNSPQSKISRAMLQPGNAYKT